MNKNIVLWGVSISPYVRKVMIALSEKQLPYQLKETLPIVLLKATGQPIPAEFDSASPLGKIPALQVDNDYMLSDSAIITQYLDLEFSSGISLYPSNPKLNAKSKWFEMYSDTVLTNVAYHKIFIEMVVKKLVLKQEPNSEIVDIAINQDLPPILKFLDTQLIGRSWFVGDNLSMADIAIATQLLALQIAGYVLSESKYPYLYKHFHKILKRESFQQFDLNV